MTLSLNGPLVLAGAGKMGSALLAGWLRRGLDAKMIVVQEPAPGGAADALMREHGVKCAAQISSLDRAPSVIVVAVKPQAIDAVWPSLAKLACADTVTLSIAAGTSIAAFERHLPARSAVVRAMPNTPAAIGRGISGAVANVHATLEQKAVCHALLAAVGDVVWLEDESLIDAVTAVSGSGPAYVFHLTECLADAGVAAGLDAATAMALARATVSGAGELLHQSDEDAAALRRNVTSPGGTTAAALDVLMKEDGGLKSLMRAAVLAAKQRGRELGS
ncbi:MAG: pyrroline-5-carboxylate reductase [Hyphomicrobium sp.]